MVRQYHPDSPHPRRPAYRRSHRPIYNILFTKLCFHSAGHRPVATDIAKRIRQFVRPRNLEPKGHKETSLVMADGVVKRKQVVGHFRMIDEDPIGIRQTHPPR